MSASFRHRLLPGFVLSGLLFVTDAPARVDPSQHSTDPWNVQIDVSYARAHNLFSAHLAVLDMLQGHFHVTSGLEALPFAKPNDIKLIYDALRADSLIVVWIEYQDMLRPAVVSGIRTEWLWSPMTGASPPMGVSFVMLNDPLSTNPYEVPLDLLQVVWRDALVFTCPAHP